MSDGTPASKILWRGFNASGEAVGIEFQAGEVAVRTEASRMTVIFPVSGLLESADRILDCTDIDPDRVRTIAEGRQKKGRKRGTYK